MLVRPARLIQRAVFGILAHAGRLLGYRADLGSEPATVTAEADANVARSPFP
jgi:hypothetical protein